MTHEEVEEAHNLLNNVCISNAMDLAPTQKYEVPQTSSQEYGWCSRPLVCFLCLVDYLGHLFKLYIVLTLSGINPNNMVLC